MKTGKDLIALGLKPSKVWKEALRHINENSLTNEEITQYVLNTEPKHIDPFTSPKKFFVNIEADSEEELSNLQAVLDDMNTVMVTPTVVSGAIMPDACPTGAGQIPVGGVVIAENAIHPGMHSADICCSVMCTVINVDINIDKVFEVATQKTHFGPGGREEFSHLPLYLKEKISKNRFLNNPQSIRLAHEHMGTQGDGNHFLFVGRLESTGKVCIVTHHGSRGFGASLYKTGMKVAEKYRKELSPKTNPKNAWIPFDTQDGKDYWEALQIVREWTELNHETIHNAILQEFFNNTPEMLVGSYRFWNEHNFVFKKDNLFYHAKGATPLRKDFGKGVYNTHLRLIPLNMKEPVLVVAGQESENNLGFAPHGAGRNIGRKAHKRKLQHKSNEEILAEETSGIKVKFFSGIPDISELPSAYKNADEVQRQMEYFGLGEVVDRILPYGCIMAGDWEQEAPWKKKKQSKNKL
jgi:tRNA-splicing ligase RtcB (3'-phosphate/5'-hydroxy nucleic acid ligase)